MVPLIEAYTHCPRCGSASFLDADPGRRCADCGHQEFNNPVASAGAYIADGRGHLLLLTRSREPNAGSLIVPGGFLDGGESLEDAVRREVREEIALDVTSLDYLGSYPNRYLFDGTYRIVVDVVFSATVANFDVALDTSEATAWDFYDPELLNPADLAFDSIRHGFELWRERPG